MNYQEKCKWLADFYREAAETGRTIQMQNVNGWMDSTIGPCLSSYTLDWRLKPEPPKAWVVWDENGIPVSVALEKWHAVKNAGIINGTTQEITRPDK
jgi:hypothetical protein